MLKTLKDATEAEKAAQIWQILVCKAYTRQTISLEELLRLMGFNLTMNPNLMILQSGYISYFCQHYNLPPLLMLIKENARKEKQTTITVEAQLKNIFEYNWFAIIPPTPIELQNIFDKNKRL